jgi:hypothetical protein
LGLQPREQYDPRYLYTVTALTPRCLETGSLLPFGR